MDIKVSRYRKMKHLHSQIQKILIQLLNQDVSTDTIKQHLTRQQLLQFKPSP